MKDEKQQMIINFSYSAIIKTVLVLLLIVALFYLKELVLVILTSVVIASSVEPIVLRLAKYRIGRITSVITVYGVILSLLFGILYFLIPVLLQQTSDFLSTVPKYLKTANIIDNNLISNLGATEKNVSTISTGLSKAQNLVSKNLTLSTPTNITPVTDTTDKVSYSSLESFIGNIQNLTSIFSQDFVSGITILFGGIFSFILIIVLSFYLSAQESGVENFLKIITPLKNEKYVIDLWRRSQQKIGLWMQGQLLLAVLVGTLVYLGMTIFGVQNALLLGVIAAIFEIIPVFGTIMTLIIGTVFGYTSGGLILALKAAAVFLIIHQFENNLFYPLVVRKIVGVPAIMVIISLVIGWELAGFLGLIIAVPFMTALTEYLDDIQEQKARLKETV
ncbi:MAG: AI-2E family transporter [Minisyncoccia bacterium]